MNSLAETGKTSAVTKNGKPVAELRTYSNRRMPVALLGRRRRHHQHDHHRTGP
ncbi:MAG: hypothetical protein PHS77_01750 [Gallionellaceae bacterium]|nr:hypothetical protein [Gallionellaceae bacterium]